MLAKHTVKRQANRQMRERFALPPTPPHPPLLLSSVLSLSRSPPSVAQVHEPGPAGVRQPLLIGGEVGRDNAPLGVAAPNGLERRGRPLPRPLAGRRRAVPGEAAAVAEHVVREVRELVAVVYVRVFVFVV